MYAGYTRLDGGVRPALPEVAKESCSPSWKARRRLNGTAAWYWLRSPRNNDIRLCVVGRSGFSDVAQCMAGGQQVGGVRPALPEVAKESCSPSRKAKATSHSTAAWYWLRSPRRDLSSLATVLNDKPGTGAVYWSTTGGVRPALPEAAKSCVARVGEHRLCITAPPLGIGSARRT